MQITLIALINNLFVFNGIFNLLLRYQIIEVIIICQIKSNQNNNFLAQQNKYFMSAIEQGTIKDSTQNLTNPEKLGNISLDFGMNLLSSFQNKIISNFQTVSHQIQNLFLKQKQNNKKIQLLQKDTREISKFIQFLKLKKPASLQKDSRKNFQINQNINMIQIRGSKNQQLGVNTQKSQMHEAESQYDKKSFVQVQTIQNETEEQGSLLDNYITELVNKKVQQILDFKKTENSTYSNLKLDSKNNANIHQRQATIQIQKNHHSFQYVKTPSINYQNKQKTQQEHSQNKKQNQVRTQEHHFSEKKQNKEKIQEHAIISNKSKDQNQNQKSNNSQTNMKTKALNQHQQQHQKEKEQNLHKNHIKQSSLTVQNNNPIKNSQVNNENEIKKIQNFQDRQMPIANFNDLEQKLLKQLSLKFMELNAKVYKIEENALNDMKINSKKFNDIQKSVQEGNLQIKKYTKSGKSYQQEVQKLRNQLNEYKLKKQSKLMKLISSASNNTGSNNNAQQGQINRYIDYMSQKIEYLLKAVNQLVPKQRYNEDIEYIHQIFGSFRKKVANVVNQKELSQKLNLMQKRVIQQLAICFQAKDQNENKNKLLKLLQEKIQTIKKNDQNSEQNNQTEKQKEQTYVSKILNTQKLLNSILEQFDQVKKSHKKLKNVQHPELQTQVVQQKNLVNQLKVKISNHENFFRDMNNEYNKKIHQIQGQIINDQQNLEKINNQLKFYKFTNFRSDTTKADSISPIMSKQQTLANQNSSSSVQHTKTDQINKDDLRSQQYILKNNLNLKKSLQMSGSVPINISNPQNQIQQLKKKVGKMSIIIQTLKSQMTSLRGDLFRDLDSVRANEDKKADWDTFKKGMAYFDERIKEMNQHINQILLTIQNNEKQESTAAKKGWTCLCCDRDIKSFEGRLGQAKFTSVFPGKHDSPRIGGYYKQNSKQKQYNQLYLNKSRRNSINKISKQELNDIK